MNSRSLLLLTLVGLTAGACASGSTTTADEPAPSGNTGAVERTFPPGTAPSRNTWTRSAQVYLDQAENTDAADEKRERYASALEQARTSIENQPNNALGYYQAGVSLVGLGQYEEAGRMFDRAEEIYPRYALDTGPLRQNAWISLYNESVGALQANDEDRAIELMMQADRIFQGRPEARTNLALIYTNRGDYEQAVEWYQRTLETLRSDQKQYLPANVQAEWADQEGDITFNLAQVYQRMGRRADAINLYREYVAENPGDAAVKTQLALALSAEGQEQEAAQIFSEVLSMEGLAEDEYYAIGIGLFNADRFDEAVIAFERAVNSNPHFRDAAFNLTQSLMAQANAAQADGATDAELVPMYERIVETSLTLRRIDPLNRSAALVLANAYRELADRTSGAASTQWRNSLLATLEEIQALPVDVTNVSLTAAGPGRLRIAGAVQNLNVTAGSPVVLRVTVLGPGGAALATEDVTVTAPARDSSVPFSAEFQVQGEIAGWRYEKI